MANRAQFAIRESKLAMMNDGFRKRFRLTTGARDRVSVMRNPTKHVIEANARIMTCGDDHPNAVLRLRASKDPATLAASVNAPIMSKRCISFRLLRAGNFTVASQASNAAGATRNKNVARQPKVSTRMPPINGPTA